MTHPIEYETEIDAVALRNAVLDLDEAYERGAPVDMNVLEQSHTILTRILQKAKVLS